MKICVFINHFSFNRFLEKFYCIWLKIVYIDYNDLEDKCDFNKFVCLSFIFVKKLRSVSMTVITNIISFFVRKTPTIYLLRRREMNIENIFFIIFVFKQLYGKKDDIIVLNMMLFVLQISKVFFCILFRLHSSSKKIEYFELKRKVFKIY
jgi:hypothetical protein